MAHMVMSSPIHKYPPFLGNSHDYYYTVTEKVQSITVYRGTLAGEFEPKLFQMTSFYINIILSN